MADKTLHITVHGLDEIKKRIADGDRVTDDELRQGVNRAVLYVHGQIPDYPPQPPTSTYVRSGNLGRENTTDVRPIGGGYSGFIGNNIKYAPWVISDEKLSDGRGPQAAVHRGRWYTLQGVVLKNQEQIYNILNDAVQNILRRL